MSIRPYALFLVLLVSCAQQQPVATAGHSPQVAPDGSVQSASTVASAPSASAAPRVCTGPAPAHAVTVYVIGDSTASVYPSERYPRMGWGQPFGELFAPACAVVKDMAISGRSSKSFYDEGAWTPVRDALASGDYVLIQFGHNDEKSEDPRRYTDPQSTYKQYLTSYITDTRQKGAVPLLLTPISRNQWNGGVLADTHKQYPPAMRELAGALRVELIDLTSLSQQYFERIGQAASTELFMNLAAGQFPNYPTGNEDNTHLRESGARKIGQLVAWNAYQRGLTLGSFLKAVPAPP